MKFTYTYRSSDGQRHTAEIKAESRDAAFAIIRRELGIKPIKVTAADGGKVDGEENGNHPSYGRGALVTAVVLFAAVLGGVMWWLLSPNGESPTANNDQPITVETPQGPVTLRVAEPLPRQAIPGNRQRIEDGCNSIFTNAAERLLACFAEPGRAVASKGEKPTEADFTACLRAPIRLASNELTEHIDLKRIVTGMKREMYAYLAGGGTVEGYLTELEKRQRLEVSYRERAEQKLNELLATAKRQAVRPTGGDLKAAYDYWLKANASLKSMGIYELPLPDPLRSYQMSLDIDE